LGCFEVVRRSHGTREAEASFAMVLRTCILVMYWLRQSGHGFAGPSDMDMDMHTKTRELQTQLYRMLILPPSSWLGSAVQLQQLRRANAILRGMACPKDLPSRAVATP
jgi:hypothetical protein